MRRVARLAGVAPGDRVVEVGAGLGALTLALAGTGARVTAVEIDRRLVGALEESLGAAQNVTIVEADAMGLDWPALLAGASRWVLVANLPYNIATPLILRLLEEAPALERMLVMVQREVGERLVARTGGRAYGAVSVKVAWWADAAVVGRVPATVFWPEPKVESALIDIRRHQRQPPGVDRQRLFELVNAGFGQRRKMLRRSLAGVGVTAESLDAAGIRADARAEQIDLEGWMSLVRRR